MKTASRFCNLVPIALLPIAMACENHPIPNNGEHTGNVPTESYESNPFADEALNDPETPAEFPGGLIALRQFLGENIQYPQRAVEEGLEGKCYAQFIVDKNGNVSNVRIVRGVPDCPECDRESIRVIRSMPRWKPGTSRNKPVSSTFNLPISFQLQ